MKSAADRVVVPSTTKRDLLIALVVGSFVLTFVLYGIAQFGRPVPGNRLTGVVVGKIFLPQKEQQISFSGRKIGEAREIDGEYLLKVQVGPRTYEVPVEKPSYLSTEVGGRMSFIRPPSEQR